VHHYNITVLSHVQIWYALNTHQKTHIVSNSATKSKNDIQGKIVKKSVKN